jgi:hypothetical protein
MVKKLLAAGELVFTTNSPSDFPSIWGGQIIRASFNYQLQSIELLVVNILHFKSDLSVFQIYIKDLDEWTLRKTNDNWQLVRFPR